MEEKPLIPGEWYDISTKEKEALFSERLACFDKKFSKNKNFQIGSELRVIIETAFLDILNLQIKLMENDGPSNDSIIKIKGLLFECIKQSMDIKYE